jgi:mannose-6-phosphate isomerase-like protein (cupin superfamily)
VHVITATEAPTFELPGIRFTGLASPSRGSQGVCTWHISIEAGLHSPQSHTLDRDEIFMITAGELRITPDAAPVTAGDTVIVPAGRPIQPVNEGAVPVEAFVVIQAGFRATMADGSDVGTPPWAA